MEDVEKKKGKKRLVSEGVEEGLVALLELLDGAMKQVEMMAKELRKINGGIKVLVEGISRLTEVVEGLGRKEVKKVNKEMEMEDVQRVDKQMEMGKEAEDSEEDEESEEEEEKEKKRDNRKEDEEEDEEKSDGTEDREEGEKK
jgi:Mg-chelatase subunit ChlI